MKKVIVTLFVSISLLYTSEGIALVMKKKGAVEHKKFNSDIFNTSIYRNKSLFNDDIIRTGVDGFTKVVYLDDGSSIKLHKNSQVFIQGKVEGSRIVKQISILTGTMKLDVVNNTKQKFKIITPTSVATIKGTRFWVDVNEDLGDKFFGLQGIVSIANNFSNNVLQLTPNNMVVSLSDGSLYVEPTRPSELMKLETLEVDAGESSQDVPPENTPNQTIPDYQNQQDNFKKLIFKVSDADGNEKILIVKYTD